MKNKKLLLALTLSLVFASLIGTVSADTTLWSSGQLSNGGFQVSETLDSAVAGVKVEGNGEYISEIGFYIRNTTAITTGAFEGRVYSSTLYGSLVATSTGTVAATTLNGFTLIEFDFDMSTQLVEHSDYIVTISVDVAVTGTIEPDTNPSFVGYYRTGTGTLTSYWGQPTGYIRTVPNAANATASPAPTGSAVTVPTDLDGIITSLTGFLVPLLITLMPAFLLWFLGGRGKWPMLIGLAIGTGLGYVFVAGFPVWLVFLVAVGIIGMAYSDVNSGNGMT